MPLSATDCHRVPLVAIDGHHRVLWQRVVLLVLAPFTIALTWVLLSAGTSHHLETLLSVSNEFLSTWPSARVFEAFKLMSLWGLLTDYGLPAPRTVVEASDDPRHEDPVPRRRARGIALGERHHAKEVDSKRMPLLVNEQPGPAALRSSASGTPSSAARESAITPLE